MSEARMAVPFVAGSPDPEVPEKAQRRKFSAEDKKRIMEDVERAEHPRFIQFPDGLVLLRPGNAAHAAFTGLVCIRRL